MVKKYNNGKELVEMLHQDMKMTCQEIADYVGVEKYVVVLWGQEKSYPNTRNYNRLQDMVLRLSGRNVKYKGQAMDILREQDEIAATV